MEELGGEGVSSPNESELVRTYRGKRVFVTGHTGFKGSWLTLWLHALGAETTGYALAPATQPALFSVLNAGQLCRHLEGDVRDLAGLQAALREARPDFVFHLAAQALVRRSYEAPLETLETNVLGTAHLLEAVRRERLPCVVVVVTSDKCYENREWPYGYREIEAMGGRDVYSMSKGGAELVVASWRRSFFPPERLCEHGVALASARAGNVIGGGDWAPDRLVPDAVRALVNGLPVAVRHPRAVRPWQHVLEPLGGYLLLGARLADGLGEGRESYCEAWNFGPQGRDAQPVARVVEGLLEVWGQGRWEDRSDPGEPHEAGLLLLSIEKAQARLGWAPRWNLTQALRHTVDWYRAFHESARGDALRALCLKQIRGFLGHVDDA